MKRHGVIILKMTLLTAFLMTGSFVMPNVPSPLNWVKVFQSQVNGENAAHAHHMPAQVIFDFSNKAVRVEEESDQKNGRLKLYFSNVSVADFTRPDIDILKRLKAVASIKDANIIQEKGGKGRVELSLSPSGSVVRLSRVEQPYNSHRIVLDIYPKRLLQELAKNHRSLRLTQNTINLPTTVLSLLPAPVKKKRHTASRSNFRVIIDPGHGGNDKGACGLEAQVTLDIAQRIKPLLEQWGATVVLTRSTDKELDLVERLGFAHQLKADAFISIHANASAGRAARGVDSYHLDPSIHERGKLFFAQQDDVALMRMYDSYLAQNVASSKSLSETILSTMFACVAESGAPIHWRGVKKEGYCILLNSQVPMGMKPPHFVPVSLVEVGFLTDKEEAAWLAKGDYRQMLANGICEGIKRYLTAE